MVVNVSFLQDILASVGERGRTLIGSPFGSTDPTQALTECARALMSGRGEATGVALAQEVLAKYGQLNTDEQRTFFDFLLSEFAADSTEINRAARAFLDDASEDNRRALAAACEAPRVEFFCRLNRAPGATAALVRMRVDLLDALGHDPRLATVDADLLALLETWFNRGFLVMQRIDWQTPASILEKIIAYEAVHEIQGWDDLRRRLEPSDRRCFAFFHPSLVDEPLIFVEVALTSDIPASIQSVLEEPARTPDQSAPSTAVFYSISNCQDGLRGISFGNFLIKQVVQELARELPSLKTFVTLSPVPRFARWLDRLMTDKETQVVSEDDREVLRLLADPDWPDGEDDKEEAAAFRSVLQALAAHYFLVAKDTRSQPVDPVARFHLGNGARLERINWLGDISPKGLRQAHGLMVNYLYDLKEIEKNHEAFANDGTVVASRQVRALLRPEGRQMQALTAKAREARPPEPRPQAALPAPAEATDTQLEKTSPEQSDTITIDNAAEKVS